MDPPTALKIGNGAVHQLAFSPDASELTVVCRFAQPSGAWDTSTWSRLRSLPGVKVAKYSLDGSLLAIADGRGGLRLWKKGATAPFHTLQWRREVVHCAAFSADGRLLSSGHGGGAAKVWDLPSGKLLQTIDAHTEHVTSIAFSRDGSFLITGGFSGSLKIWDTSSWSQLEEFERPEGDTVLDIAVSPDGRTLATAHRAGVVLIWDTVTWTASVHRGYASAAFSPDGTTLAMGGMAVLLWDVPRKRVRDRFSFSSLEMYAAQSDQTSESNTAERPSAGRSASVAVSALAFSPDGRWLAAGCFEDGSWTVRFTKSTRD